MKSKREANRSSYSPHTSPSSSDDHQHNEKTLPRQRGSTADNSHFVAAPSTAFDVVLGVGTQLARKYLFVDVRRRALFYLVFVVVSSLISEFYTLPDHYWFVKKNNVFNVYGTKIGWFWTCFLLTPFIWLTSLLHHGSRRKALKDLVRLAIATFWWHFCTYSFVKVEHHTARCHGAELASRSECAEQGGKWIPGFDISGHTFILIYSILLIGEEVCSFRNWPSSPRQSTNRVEYLNYRTSMKIVQVLFILLFVLHLVWEFQLVVTLLYYHTLTHKIFGALVALFCWFATYHVWYPLAFPFSPIRRHLKHFD